MLTAGQAATEKALRNAGLHSGDIDVYEIAEAFAATCVKFQRDLNLADDQLNPQRRDHRHGPRVRRNRPDPARRPPLRA